MRQDSFEKYIEENRERFDEIENFDQDLLWEEISEKNQTSAKNKIWPLLFLGFLLISLIIFSLTQKPKPDVDFGPIALLDEEAQRETTKLYKQVQHKEAEAFNRKVAGPEIDELFDELKSMEAIEELLKENFKDVGTNEKLASTLIQYYESKSRLLELILFEIAKKEKNEKIEKKIF